MTAADLLTIGFERCGDALRAPDGSSVTLTALDVRCYRLVITLPSAADVSVEGRRA